MDHFEDITPDNRWKNDLLRELRELNQHFRDMKHTQEEHQEAAETTVRSQKRQYKRKEVS